MRKRDRDDIIDKLFDRLWQSVEKQGFIVSQELTYIGVKAIAARLGMSRQTCARGLRYGTILHYVKYMGKRRSVRSNETMVRLTYLGWYKACMDERHSKMRATAIDTRGEVPPIDS